MARWILVFLFIALLTLGLVAIWKALRGAGSVASDSLQEARLPDTFKRISYVLLIVLMFGVVTGWLGGL